MQASNRKGVYRGIALAILAGFIWSGNFIVARGVYKEIPPLSIAFYRWLLATLIILAFAFRKFRAEWPVVNTSWHFLCRVSLTGIALFHTFVYIGAHYTSAISLALIGTTTSPNIATIMARIFLEEQIGWMRFAGLVLCI